MPLMPTGIPKLDELVGGGLEKGSAALIYMTPGLEGAVFAQQMMLQNLQAGGNGLYAVTNKTPESVADAVQKLSWKSSQFKKVKFIDCFSASLGQASSQKYFVKEPWKVEAIGEVLGKAAKENEGGMLVFDTFSSVAEKNGEAKALSALEQWKASLKKSNITSVCLFTDWSGDAKAFERVSKPFDYAVRLQAVEEKMLLRNYFTVGKALKMNAGGLERGGAPSAVPFKVGMEGVAVYVPKILVTGPFHAGKSSFIHAVSTRAVSVDRLGTTIALDHGYIDYGGMSLDLFGTPGQERFTFMIDILNRDVFGVILLVDSTEPEFDRAADMLKYVSKYGIPTVVAANKQDAKGAMKPDDIKKGLVKLGLPQTVKVVGTSAVTKKGCIDIVKVLVDEIVGVKK
ncbi:MAG: ATPase domain-containing protein [Candidatus Micrarchaeia archaeon]